MRGWVLTAEGYAGPCPRVAGGLAAADGTAASWACALPPDVLGRVNAYVVARA